VAARNKLIIRVDNGPKIKARMRRMKGAKAGYLSETTGGQMPYDKSDLTLATNAIYQEYGTKKSDGTKHIPARPFMALAARMFEKSPHTVGRLCRAYLQGKMTGGAFNDKLGALQAADIQASLSHGSFEANADATVKAKGSSKPLADKGHLRQGVDSIGKR